MFRSLRMNFKSRDFLGYQVSMFDIFIEGYIAYKHSLENAMKLNVSYRIYCLYQECCPFYFQQFC